MAYPSLVFRCHSRGVHLRYNSTGGDRFRRTDVLTGEACREAQVISLNILGNK